MLKPVYTEPENCQDCYKCIRECPVKAIMVEDNKASIIENRCIYCGHCTQVCPTGAKKVRDGLTRARLTIARHPGKVYLSLAPSYVSEFGDIPLPQLIESILELGFSGVSETALGAELVSAETDRYLEESPYGFYISSACPVVVDYVRKYAPEHTSRITPIMSPMLAHAKMLKGTYGNDIKVIFAGPCIAKKSESDSHQDLIDVAITFGDLRKWFESEGVIPEKTNVNEDSVFIPYRSGLGSLYPIEGGMLAGMAKPRKKVSYMAFSDLSTVKEVLDGLDTEKREDSIFLELLSCRGGCINGPAKVKSTSLAMKRYDILNASEEPEVKPVMEPQDLYEKFTADIQDNSHQFPETEILQALASVGKTTPEDELNCSGCGYDTCRDFAVAMLVGRAEDNMCASYMRKVAHDKATVLLQKIPAGVMLVSDQMKVVDMNRNFATAMGEDTLDVYDICPGMEGADVRSICSFEALLRTALTTGEEIRERRISEGDKTWLLSIYNIQPHRLVFALLQDLYEPAVRKEWMLEKTREVIKNHMVTVQQVAGLLGENAAFTDATLRSIIDAYGSTDEKTDERK